MDRLFFRVGDFFFSPSVHVWFSFLPAAPKRSSCFSFDSDDYDSDGSYEDYPNFSIGWPSEVKHIVHVTFDRFRGFLGLPKDFEQQVSKRAPSAR